MSDLVKAAEQDTTLAALREREQELAKSLATMRLDVRVMEAQHAELCAVIDLVQRGGKRKPGPKTGTHRTPAPTALINEADAGTAQETEKPIPEFLRRHAEETQ